MTFKEFYKKYVAMGSVFCGLDDKKKMNRWSVSVSLYQHFSNRPKLIIENFEYFTGTALSTTELDGGDFLYSLHSDCRASEMKFVEFCEEFGYTNVREADTIYKACINNTNKLRRALGPMWNQFMQCTEE